MLFDVNIKTSSAKSLTMKHQIISIDTHPHTFWTANRTNRFPACANCTSSKCLISVDILMFDTEYVILPSCPSTEHQHSRSTLSLHIFECQDNICHWERWWLWANRKHVIDRWDCYESFFETKRTHWVDASDVPIKSVQHWKYSAAFKFVGRESNIYLTNLGF